MERIGGRARAQPWARPAHPGGGVVSGTRIAVVGAGLIGRRHIALVRGHRGCTLVSVVDPDPAARDGHGVPGHADVPTRLADAARMVCSSPPRTRCTPNTH